VICAGKPSERRVPALKRYPAFGDWKATICQTIAKLGMLAAIRVSFSPGPISPEPAMKTHLVSTLLAFVLLGSFTFGVALSQDENLHSANRPAPRDPNWIKRRHEKLNEEVKRRGDEIKLLFIGDSITDAWSGPGKEQWNKHFAPRGAVNLGIGGDRTQHVLWRLQNGNIEGLKPKAAVLMIGTNNSNGNDNTAEEIADGIKAIVAELRKDLPETKILLLAIFPRGQKPSAQREKNAKASKLASEVADGKMVHYLDIGDKFLNEDATLSKDIMPDYLHLTPKGYEIWADAIEPKVAELMGEK
jgi:beta-glucosidase